MDRRALFIQTPYVTPPRENHLEAHQDIVACAEELSAAKVDVRLLCGIRATASAIYEHLTWLLSIERPTPLFLYVKGSGATLARRSLDGDIAGLEQVLLCHDSWWDSDRSLTTAEEVSRLFRSFAATEVARESPLVCAWDTDFRNGNAIPLPADLELEITSAQAQHRLLASMSFRSVITDRMCHISRTPVADFKRHPDTWYDTLTVLRRMRCDGPRVGSLANPSFRSMVDFEGDPGIPNPLCTEGWAR